MLRCVAKFCRSLLDLMDTFGVDIDFVRDRVDEMATTPSTLAKHSAKRQQLATQARAYKPPTRAATRPTLASHSRYDERSRGPGKHSHRQHHNEVKRASDGGGHIGTGSSSPWSLSLASILSSSGSCHDRPSIDAQLQRVQH